MTFGKLARRGLDDLWSEGNFWDWAEGRTQLLPAVDVEESEGEYVFRAELPGLKKEDVKISLEDNGLTLSGEKRSEARQEGKTYHRVERAAGSFKRTYAFSKPVEAGKVTAQYKDGVLEIRVPKAVEARPKAVEIKID